MKPAVFILIAIMLAGLVAGLSSATISQREVVKPAASPRVVYVDAYSLLETHPGWDALMEIKATLAESETGNPRLGNSGDNGSRPGSRFAPVSGGTSVSRSRLVEESCLAAYDSLGDLESQRYDALKARIAEKRRTLIENAESEFKVRLSEIESEVAQTIRESNSKDWADSLNARIKLQTLKTVRGSSDLKGLVDESRYLAAQTAVDAIEDQHETRITRIEDDRDRKVAELEDRVTSQIDAALDVYAMGRNRNIDRNITAVRCEIVDEINSPRIPADTHRKKLTVGANGIGLWGNGPVIRNNDKTLDANWDNGLARMRVKLMEDMKNAVRELAAEQGMRVVFTKSGCDTPDETKRFKQLMDSRAWEFCTPVLSAVNGS